MVLHEILHELKCSKRKGLILKMDFEKSYNRVRWNFLEEALRTQEFPTQWLNWVMQTVRGGKVCINANGQWGGPISELLEG